MDDVKRYPIPSGGRSLSTTRRSRSRITAVIVAVCFFMFLVHIRPLGGVQVQVPVQMDPKAPAPAPGTPNPPAKAASLVPLEAHIMSKCPDARDCLKHMVLPVMERMHDKVNFTLSFIGTPDGDSGVACPHGPAECMGNILELCAAELYPDPKTYLGFTMCISNDYRNIPKKELIEGCALEHALDLKALNECATKDNGAYGTDMLRESVQRTEKAGVSLSCTVRLADEIWCIRDGGQWSECPQGPEVEKLVAAIEKKYQQQSS
ncbi:hypothetical protein MAPG_05155 [Magnaporthiopsis poae ATCC 64411]|uniref:Gamma interferon inducible lysosomal thiol reductase n=1 Tax=Magnaporthiopsis poae (strain ATCC 64411 / 73-15) TaxID=644358 RepID=A0A0C4DYM9_MAGP6|nr:hypothetical protein MAPG_05155 [Magnaporthiopsis poae ATCC 64411]